jgi:NAD(P)-dependent dehydrogenase (short-subunit alcohol dehydrogenase family)
LPGKNGLGFYTTATEAIRDGVSLERKNIIITGGYKGLGASTVEALAPLNPVIWLPARPQSFANCVSFAKSVSNISMNPNIFCEEMDLESFNSIRQFADKWKKENGPLHILILNAGVGARAFSETEDGFESIWQSNHLGHFLLTNLLLDNLKLGAPCRVVSVSSIAHENAHINWEDISGKNTWYQPDSWLAPVTAYSQSKTANILFAKKLNEVLKGYGVSNSLHPGIIENTELDKNSGNNPIILFIVLLGKIFGKTLAQGAATQVYLATAPELATVGGYYFDNCNIVQAAPHSTDPKEMEKLWYLSLESVKKWLD